MQRSANDLTDDVLDNCNIVPPPNREDVVQVVQTAKHTIENVDEEDTPTEQELVELLSTAFEVRRRLDTDEWIQVNSSFDVDPR